MTRNKRKRRLQERQKTYFKEAGKDKLFSKIWVDWEHHRDAENPFSYIYLVLATTVKLLSFFLALLNTRLFHTRLCNRSFEWKESYKFVRRVWHHLVVDAQSWLCPTEGCLLLFFFFSAAWVSNLSTSLCELYHQNWIAAGLYLWHGYTHLGNALLAIQMWLWISFQGTFLEVHGSSSSLGQK